MATRNRKPTAMIGRLFLYCFIVTMILFGNLNSPAADLTKPDEDDSQWIVYDGGDGPGAGKHLVFVTGDDEYRSEEGMPMLAKILSVRHGFKCTVLFAIDPKDGTIKPDHQTNIPGLDALDSADLMVIFTRFRHLPDDQMKHIVDFMNSGKPMIGLRTSTHAFNYPRESESPYAKFSFNSREPRGGFGQAVLGDTWINHHGHHGRESTRGVKNEKYTSHPVLRDVEDVWGPTDVYGVRNLTDDAQVLLYGQVVAGMSADDPPVEGKKNDPMMPVVWTKTYTGTSGKPSRVLCTTMGAANDLQSAGLRRLLVNACFWGLEMEDKIPVKANVDYVGEYEPTNFGFGTYKKGLKPTDYALEE